MAERRARGRPADDWTNDLFDLHLAPCIDRWVAMRSDGALVSKVPSPLQTEATGPCCRPSKRGIRTRHPPDLARTGSESGPNGLSLPPAAELKETR